MPTTVTAAAGTTEATLFLAVPHLPPGPPGTPTMGAMTRSNALGEFLRARRAATRPDSVGLPAGGRRRVPGLRRDEVAVLAGVSTDYYVRLEQGRERHPSAEDIIALGRVFDLDGDAVAHLHRLARPQHSVLE